MKHIAKHLRVFRLSFTVLLTVVALGIVSTATASFTTLYEFTAGYNDAGLPYGGLTLDGSTFYGMSYFGGSNYNGVIFKTNIDGSGFTNIHRFVGGNDDGQRPYGDLTLSGNTLYGMTFNGGDDGVGVIFKVDTDGGNYTNLHDFAGGADDGANPYGSLILDGSTLYGMAWYGGDSDYGVIFKIETNGSNFTIMHEFAGGTDDGANPRSSLVLDGNTLYGMTDGGGSNYYGTIFKINTDGSNHTIMYSFEGGTADGRHPRGSLTLNGNSLAGMTLQGGTVNYGIIFKIDTDGSDYEVLHQFLGGNFDGANPHGSLILNGNTFAGMTYYGGVASGGCIFEMTTDGNYYTNLHSFYGNGGDGYRPEYGSLVKLDGYYYGMTASGGTNGVGVLFKQLIPEPTVSIMALLTAGLLLARRKDK